MSETVLDKLKRLHEAAGCDPLDWSQKELDAELSNHADAIIALIEAAKAVDWFDWSDNDDDAKEAINKLGAALKPFGVEQ